MKTNRVAGLALIGLLVAGGAVAGGFGKSRGMMMDGGYGGNSCLNALELTDDQQSLFQQYKSEMRTNMESLRENMEANNPMAAAIADDGAFDKEAFIAAAQSRHDQATELKADYAELMYNTLTDEQKATFADQLANGEKCMLGGGHPRGPRGHGF